MKEAQSGSETIKVGKKGKVGGKKKALTVVEDSLDGELEEEEYEQTDTLESLRAKKILELIDTIKFCQLEIAMYESGQYDTKLREEIGEEEEEDVGISSTSLDSTFYDS